MNLKLSLSAALASLLFAAPVFAQQTPPPQQGEMTRHPGKGHPGRGGGMEKRLHRMVEKGRLTQQQADQFLAEGRALREEVQAQRQSSGGQLSEQQKHDFRERRHALRERIHAAMKPSSQG